MRLIRVHRAGLSTTVQDRGRVHSRHLGVAVGGAMDLVSYEMANRLVGNSPDAATLEMTLTGDELQWTFDSVISVTGADMAPVARIQSEAFGHSNESVTCFDVPLHRPVFVPAGTVIQFQSARRGCRCYVAVAGGIDVPMMLGSRSTLVRASLGGLNGRRLQAGDELNTATTADPFQARVPLTDRRKLCYPDWFVRVLDLPPADTNSEVSVRVIAGSHLDLLMTESRKRFADGSFQISSASDRMGYRLEGMPLALKQPLELESEGTAIGTIQLPPNGQPIVLMSDCAPTGGYPRIAHVISADLPTVAQLRPGQRLRFQSVTLEDAQTAMRQQRREVERALAMSSLHHWP